MITDSFDNRSPAIINPVRRENAPEVDACIVTFSHEIEKYVAEKYASGEIAALWCASGKTPVYLIERNGRRFAFYRTYVGAPITVGLMEDAMTELKCDRYILFGGAGCLNKEIAHGKVMVPTAAYRDEGTSYHYAPAADYVDMKNAAVVAECMKANGIPYALGKTWTTDSFYRETRNNFEKRKADGCISVEMESAGVQAMCDFRNVDLYAFFTGGDLLDAPEWNARQNENNDGGQHDVGHFSIALALAEYVASLPDQHVRIEPFDMKYLDEYYTGFNREITKYQWPDPFESREAAEELLQSFLDEMERGETLLFSILSGDDRFLGSVEIHGVDGDCPELGIWVKEPEQNKGYAYRALGEALRYARKHYGNVAFYYEADVRNMGSLRLLDKFADEYEIIPYEPEKVTTDSGKELELRGYELRVK